MLDSSFDSDDSDDFNVPEIDSPRKNIKEEYGDFTSSNERKSQGHKACFTGRMSASRSPSPSL